MGKPEGYKKNWEDPGVDGGINIKTYLQELGLGGTDWFDLAQDRYRRRALVNAVMKFWVP